MTAPIADPAAWDNNKPARIVHSVFQFSRGPGTHNNEELFSPLSYAGTSVYTKRRSRRHNWVDMECRMQLYANICQA